MSRWKRITILAVAGVFLVLLALFLLADRLTSAEWKEKKAAVLTAYEQTMLVKTDRVETFVGEETWRVVFGEDKLQKKMIVWIGEQSGIHSEYEAAGVSRDAVTGKVTETDPEARIIRVTPGKLAADYVWEVYYERSLDNGKTAGFYDYYRFADGTLLDTYRLGAKS